MTIWLGSFLLPGPTLALAECISIDETGWTGPNLVNGLPDPGKGFLIPYFDLKAVSSDVAGSASITGDERLEWAGVAKQTGEGRDCSNQGHCQDSGNSADRTNVGGASAKRDGVNRKRNEQDHTC